MTRQSTEAVQIPLDAAALYTRNKQRVVLSVSRLQHKNIFNICVTMDTSHPLKQRDKQRGQRDSVMFKYKQNRRVGREKLQTAY